MRKIVGHGKALDPLGFAAVPPASPRGSGNASTISTNGHLARFVTPPRQGHHLRPLTPVSDRRYGSPRWKKLRLGILRRDNYQCQIRGPNCRGTANTVNHRLAVSEGGAFFDPENLEASCGACNFSGGAYLTNDRRRAIIEDNKYLEGVVRALAGTHRSAPRPARATRSATAPARPRAQPSIR